MWGIELARHLAMILLTVLALYAVGDILGQLPWRPGDVFATQVIAGLFVVGSAVAIAHDEIWK
jgi:hypothetical protein